MNESQFITIKSIDGVIYVAKNNPVGKVDYYTVSTGLRTYEMIYRLSGEVETEFDGKRLVNIRDSIQFLPKGKGKNQYKVTTLKTGECIDIFFDSDIPFAKEATIIKPNNIGEVRLLFTELEKIWFRKDANYFYNSMGILYKILAAITEDKEYSKFSPFFKKIRPAVEYINLNFYKTIDFISLSKKCGISYSYFRKLFLECYGISAKQYIVNKRIEYSKELLISGQYSITEISEKSGFSDVYYYSRTFKKMTGFSPSKYTEETTL